MKLSFLIISILFLIIACQQSPQPAITAVSDYDQQSFRNLASQFDRFAPITSATIPDSTELFFYGEGADSIFLLHCKQDSDKISARVYQVSRAYNHDARISFDPWKNPTFYEGFSARLDSSQWRQLTRFADSILMLPLISGTENIIMDNPDYALAFNGRVMNDAYFEHWIRMDSFAACIKRTFLNDYMAKRAEWLRRDDY